MTFNHIEHSLIDGNLILFLSCNEDEKLQAEIIIEKSRLMELYADEFVVYRRKQHNNNPPDWIPNGNECSLEFWYENYMSKSKAWQIFEAVNVDELTFNTTE